MSGGEPSCAIGVRDPGVLVTAGASGVGRAVAAAFAGAGAKVHIDDCAIVGDAVSQIAVGRKSLSPSNSAPIASARAPSLAERSSAPAWIGSSSTGRGRPAAPGQAISHDGNVEYL